MEIKNESRIIELVEKTAAQASAMSFLEGLFWLTLNVYHEARGEAKTGQLAVAHVTLNRVMQRQLSVEEIVTAPYQFSWTFRKKSYLPTEWGAFMECMESAFTAMTTPDFTDGATFYHRSDIHPSWADSMEFLSQYGAHSFYRDPRAVTPIVTSYVPESR